MKSRHFRTSFLSTDVLSMRISDRGILSGSASFADVHKSSVAGDAMISDLVFKALIKTAVSRDEQTPLNLTITRLLGLSTDDEVIFTKQIGVCAGEDLHGLIVSIKPHKDDIILINRTSTMMEIYLADSRRQLRAAALLKRDSVQPNLVSIEHAAAGYARELNFWAMVGEKAGL